MALACLVCLAAYPPVHARTLPNPNQRPAPGNEVPPPPIAAAGYSTPVNYQLQCAGCHLDHGQGSAANDTPRMAGFVGNFLKVPGGREFLVRVPGISQSALSDGQIADLLNWLLAPGGMAGASTPARWAPYTREEVARVRGQSMLNLPDVRAGLIGEMKAQGIAIEDGMTR
ncbi:cytochrome C [Pseudomonas entomophila]|nr:cytochrome C [Pseudomonas entomophila]MDF0733111.1 cytochrome C [Pseudomonas entomophila]